MAEKAKRRILNLWPHEVSIVENPANFQPFILTKSDDPPLPKSLNEFIAMRERGESLGVQTSKTQNDDSYFKLTKNGTEIEVSPVVEKAFPGLRDEVRSLYSAVVKELTGVMIDAQLNKRKELTT